MAHCVVSRVHDAPYVTLLAGLDATACVVHCHYQPCPLDGQPASPEPLHADDHLGRVRAVAEWTSRTDRQRPLVVHRGNLASRAPAHETDGVLCWCRPEVVPAAVD